MHSLQLESGNVVLVYKVKFIEMKVNLPHVFSCSAFSPLFFFGK